jgi:hypothetical protein
MEVPLLTVVGPSSAALGIAGRRESGAGADVSRSKPSVSRGANAAMRGER